MTTLKATLIRITMLIICMVSLPCVASAATNVILEHSETLSFDKKSGRDYQILRGNVRFRHDDAVMYCDSAYFYDKNNSFDAFGHVRVVQDTMSMTASTLYYDGNTRIMRVRGGVTLRNGAMELTSDWLDYFRNEGYGFYADGGKLVDPDFTLTSDKGYYYPRTKFSFFKGNVHLVNPDYTIDTDSLKFNQRSNLAYVVGPSVIKYSDYTVETTNAWTNTQSHYGHLYNRSQMRSKDGSFMIADSIYFSNEQNRVELFGNAIAMDDSSKTGFTGDYAWIKRNPESGFAAGRACMMDYSNAADTMFLHGDTITFTSNDDKQRQLYAYHHVKLFSLDMQGKCDSLSYLQSDSIIRLDSKPVIWSDGSQMSGDTIKIYLKGNDPDWIHIEGNAFIIQQQAIDCFDQLSAKESKAYLEGKSMRQVDMIGNAMSLYYAQDEDNELIGVNRCQGSFMSIFLKKNRMDKIKMTPDSKGTMFPPGRIPATETKLRGFKWRADERPLTKEDIFVW